MVSEKIIKGAAIGYSCAAAPQAFNIFSIGDLSIQYEIAFGLFVYSAAFLCAAVVYEILADRAKRRNGEMRYMKFKDDSDYYYVWAMLTGACAVLVFLA